MDLVRRVGVASPFIPFMVGPHIGFGEQNRYSIVSQILLRSGAQELVLCG